jgi:hypothetical protein
MGLNRYAKRRDGNEHPIVQALIAAGCDVIQMDAVDIIVGRAGINYMLEIKQPKRRRQLQPSQIKLRDSWRGQYAIVSSAQEALKVVGL